MNLPNYRLPEGWTWRRVVAEIGNGMIKVKSDEDGEILIGNTWDDL